MAQFRREHPLDDPRKALRSVAAAWSKHPSNPKNPWARNSKQEDHSPTITGSITRSPGGALVDQLDQAHSESELSESL